jgi:methylated-DNA-protein-cysteine methyltransferase-like protein
MPLFTDELVVILRAIPRGRVASYGQIATLAGNARGARQVSRLLAAASGKYGLPWHRVVNSRGGISLPRGGGFEEQRSRLQAEGVQVSQEGFIDLARYGWNGVP